MKRFESLATQSAIEMHVFSGIDPNVTQGHIYPASVPALLLGVINGHSKALEVFVDQKQVSCE